MGGFTTEGAAQYTRAQRLSVLISAVLGFGVDFYDLIIFSFFIPAIRTTLHITLLNAGLIASVQLIGSVLGGIGFGWIGDAYGRKRSLLFSITLYSLGALISALSWSYGSLVVFRFITGLGLGGEWGAGMVLFNEVWPDKKRGLGSSIVQASALAGLSAAGFVAHWALTSFGPDGWRIGLATGAAPLLLALYARFSMPESRVWSEFKERRAAGLLPEDKAKQAAPIVEVFRGRALRYTVTGLLMVGGYMFGFNSIQVFWPTLMTTTFKAPTGAVAAINGIVSWVGIGIYLLIGWMSDRRGRKIAFATPALVSVLAFAWFYLRAHSQAPYSGGYLGWSMFWWYLIWQCAQDSAAMFGPWFSELFPVEMRVTAVSLIYMVGRGAASLAPIVVPIVAASSGLFSGMSIGVVGALVLLLMGLTLPETLRTRFKVVDRVGNDVDATAR